MSELIDNARRRKDLLKHMIRQIHGGVAPDQVRTQVVRLLGQVPYGDVVEVEQELINEGVPTEEILRLCDLHSAALHGVIDVKGAREVPPGHPLHTFREENKALSWETDELARLYANIDAAAAQADASETMGAIRMRFNNLMDVEKHYLRKEYLLFPFLEKHGITGPPKVMWGKHDEARALLKGAMEALAAADSITAEEAHGVIQLVLKPASAAVSEMIDKEEHILLPMCLDTLTEAEWHEIAQQSLEYGFCLYDPPDTWRPAGTPAQTHEGSFASGRVQLPSGSLTPAELTAILNTIPFDLTFVDKDDTVRYFTQGRERIFSRSRAILGRKVQFCHPPSSVKVVEQILSDFHSGRHDRAAFWINMRGRFIHIEYFALRDPEGGYLGCLEVSQDLTEKRALTGEQRLLSYTDREGGHAR
ncbi:MAG: DUF438 domain-containing protein [Acidobacteria bacterium]|nr:DUF438 domain-containing protein [Acidobacteriota bacterium]